MKGIFGGLFQKNNPQSQDEVPMVPLKVEETARGKSGLKTTHIKWMESAKSSIAQIYSSGLEYSLANAQGQQCHDFVYCKDFIQDAIHAHLHGGIAQIYGFTYNPKIHPSLSMDRLRILLVNASDSKMGEKITNVADFINQFCKKLKMKPTQFYEADNPVGKYKKCGAYLIDASGMWQNAPVLVSMFTLLLRVGFVHVKGEECMETIKKLIDGNVKPYQTNDRHQTQSGLKGIENILKWGYRKFFFIDISKNYPKSASIGTMHNQTGIVAFATGASKSVVKHWNRRSATDPEFKAKLEAKRAEEAAKKLAEEGPKDAVIETK